MPTYIYFAGDDMRVHVDEDPSQVAEAFVAAGGLPFRLTAHDEQGAVYVNPLTMAFWSAAEADHLPASPQEPAQPTPESPQEPARPTKRQQVVTDVWGRPIRTTPPE